MFDKLQTRSIAQADYLEPEQKVQILKILTNPPSTRN